MIVGANVYQTAMRMGGVEFSDAPMTVQDYCRCIRQMSKLGYNGAEILTDPMLMAFDAAQQRELAAELVKVREQTGIQFSVHLPFWWDDIAVPDEALRAAATENMIRVIRLLQPLEPAHYVLHSLKGIPDRVRASQASEAVTSAAMGRVRANADKSIARIVECLPSSRLLCVENLPDANFDLERPLIEKHDTSICLDIGHLFITGGDIRAFYARDASRIRAIHAHNVRPEIAKHPFNWRLVDHYGLSSGLLDYVEILGWLGASGFSGTFVVEIRNSEGADDSMTFLRKHGFV